MKKFSVGVSVLFSLALLVGSFGAVVAADPVQLVTEYPLPGSPFRVAVEGTGLTWVTLPARNTIGRLVVASSGTPDFREFQLPTAGSHPYDIAYAAGSVWVSEHVGNKIARYDPVADTWIEYLIPTPDSKPTGLTVLPGDPIQVWFCEQASSKLGRLTITATGISQFAEFPLPMAWSGAKLENIAATSSANVWFTVPGISGIGLFDLSVWQSDPGNAYDFVTSNPLNDPKPTNPTKPYDIKIDGQGVPWITEPSTNRIGRLNPGTLTNFEWYPVNTPDSGLAGLDLALGYVWFTQRDSGRMGRLLKVGYQGRVGERSLPGAAPAPTDIAMGPDGCAWVSASGVDALVSWCAPYFRQLYLPLLHRK